MEDLIRSYVTQYYNEMNCDSFLQEDVDGISSQEINNLLFDLEHYPHAFILGCTMDYLIKADIAWSIPLQVKMALDGDFSMKTLGSLSKAKYEKIFRKMNPSHRFPKKSAYVFYRAVGIIKDEYNGNASKMWSENSAELFIKRFKSFYNVGQKISNMAANLLYTHLNVKFSDMDKIDIAVDRHVERVFTRTGLVMPSDNIKKMVIAKARELCPDYPGKLDLPIFNLGRNCCTRQNPECDCCPLAERCQKNNIG